MADKAQEKLLHISNFPTSLACETPSIQSSAVNPPRHSIFIQCEHSQSPNMGKFFRSPSVVHMPTLIPEYLRDMRTLSYNNSNNVKPVCFYTQLARAVEDDERKPYMLKYVNWFAGIFSPVKACHPGTRRANSLDK